MPQYSVNNLNVDCLKRYGIILIHYNENERIENEKCNNSIPC